MDDHETIKAQEPLTLVSHEEISRLRAQVTQLQTRLNEELEWRRNATAAMKYVLSNIDAYAGILDHLRVAVTTKP